MHPLAIEAAARDLDRARLHCMDAWNALHGDRLLSDALAYVESARLHLWAAERLLKTAIRKGGPK